jgi:hypothetical protein
MNQESAPKDFPAPWEVYPEIPCGSIHWRMGPGEHAMVAFAKLLQPLSKDQLMAYLQLHPYPQDWKWWIDRMIERWNQPGDL